MLTIPSIQKRRRRVLVLLYFLFNVLGTNRGPTDRIQNIKKHYMFKAFDNTAPVLMFLD